MNIETYSEKAVVVKGPDTRYHKEKLKAMGGKWNSALKGGCGWIFSATKESELREWIASLSTPFITPAKNPIKSVPTLNLDIYEQLKKLTIDSETFMGKFKSLSHEDQSMFCDIINKCN